ncbi:hypothetical protein I7I48_01268 [Histoplasma ohiense]|nr:hypothetical protein I7I48_01268 [Histoplasma ohiense (nom. inval.)]
MARGSLFFFFFLPSRRATQLTGERIIELTNRFPPSLCACGEPGARESTFGWPGAHKRPVFSPPLPAYMNFGAPISCRVTQGCRMKKQGE